MISMCILTIGMYNAPSLSSTLRPRSVHGTHPHTCADASRGRILAFALRTGLTLIFFSVDGPGKYRNIDSSTRSVPTFDN